MQRENVVVTNRLLRGVLLDVRERGKTVADLTHRALVRDSRSCTRSHWHLPIRERAHLFERERVALDGGGGVYVASARVLLHGREPTHVDGGAVDACTQGGNALDLSQQRGGDGELRDVGDVRRLAIGQA